MNKDFKKIQKILKNSVNNKSAYKKTLASFNVKSFKINSQETFEKLPILDKQSYIKKFKLPELISDKKFPSIAYSSSGSSGQPTFWFKNKKQEEYSTSSHKKIYDDIFQIHKSESTLVIICFSMGIWVAGNSEFEAFRALSNMGYNITIITPGIEKSDIHNIFKQLVPYFEKVILAGYPPFIANLLHELKKQNFKFKHNLKILTAGDSFSEHWRKTIMELIGTKKLTDVINIYGCADAGFLGYETPLSIFLRNKALNSSKIFLELFGNIEKEPAFVQYDPNYIFFETQKNELILTANTGIPLIRYNIHDIGKVIPYNKIKLILKHHNLIQEVTKHGLHKWQMPFITKTSRTDVSVTFYAINIYPENFISAIDDKRISKKLSGNFRTYTKDGKNHKTHRLHVILELKASIFPTNEFTEIVKKVIIEHLIKDNIEYRKLFNTIGKKAIPEIKLVKFGQLEFKNGLVYQNGKKPKLIKK
jgi:phenylacetate-CoA ligase